MLVLGGGGGEREGGDRTYQPAGRISYMLWNCLNLRLIFVGEGAEADLRKGALSAAYGGAHQWRKISILVDPT